MLFGIEKCKTLCIAKGKLQKRIFTTEDNDTMEAMNEDDMYRYLGHMQAKQINLLTPNVNYSGRTAPLASKVAFFTFIQQI